MANWATGSHSDVPADAAMVLGTHDNGIVTWLEGTPTEAPENVDLPHVSQSGAVLTCTKGNWKGTPTAYAYQWQVDGVDVGTDSATYDVQAGDAGKLGTCAVTATNDIGSTTAADAVGVVIEAGAEREATHGHKGRHHGR